LQCLVLFLLATNLPLFNLLALITEVKEKNSS
jgi:hypothetical protein